MKPINSLWTGSRVRSAHWIHEKIANKTFEDFLTYFSAVEKKLRKGIVISYATKIPDIHLAVTNMAAGICDSLHLMVKQGKAVPIRREPNSRTWAL